MASDEELQAIRPLADFLDRLYQQSDRYSTYESAAKRCGVSRQTLSAFLNAQRFPARDFVEKYVSSIAAESARSAYLEKSRDLWEDTWAHVRAIRFREKRQSKSHSADDSALNLSPILPATPGTSDRFLKEVVPVTFYKNNAEFYGAATDYVRGTTSDMRLTYIRQTPPTLVTSTEASEYFREVLAWAAAPGYRSVVRIVGAPMDGDRPRKLMLDWIEAHREETANISNYEFRVVPWLRKGDYLNMALFDDDTSFLAVSGESKQNLSGLSISPSRGAHSYFLAHFQQLWYVSEGSDDFLGMYSR